MQIKEIEVFYPRSQTAWRIWLQENHLSKQAVWLVFYNKKSEKKSITWGDAVDEALCFGWIDSKKISIDKETSHQYFSKRKPKSTWSKINKQKIQRLIEQDLMMEAGYASIALAKHNGSWTMIDDVEELIIPKDLSKAFGNNKGSKKYFLSLSKSKQKYLLQWIVLAKQTQIRQKRIDEIALCASEEKMPKHLQ
jgi:uncharacterized protein YdeI (YjbR/CyaY-like superfamily)